MIYRLESLKWSLICNVLLILVIDVPIGISANNGIIFSCSFTRDTCKMSNQARAQWKREYLNIGGRNGYSMVVRGNDATNHFARLLTPDISTQNAKTGCLRFVYFIDGRKPASIAVIKQGFVTEYIFGTARKTIDHWEQAEVEVKFLGDKAMFYFESDTRVQVHGDSMVAFSDLTISTDSCHQKRRLR